MKYFKVALASFLISYLPLTSSASIDIEKEAFEQRYAVIDNGVATIDNVRSAVISSYVKNDGWPNINSLVTNGYLRSTKASWGNSVTGLVGGAGNSYTLSLIAPSPDMAQGMAAKLGGVAAGSSVQIVIPVPAAASLNKDNLRRNAVAGSPEFNQMFTNIDMNSNELNNVSKIDAVILNASTAKLGATIIETSLEVIPDAKFNRNVEILGKTVSNDFEGQTIKISGGAEVGTLKTLGLAEVGSVKSAGDINGLNIVGSNDIVAGNQIRSTSAVISGGVSGDSANFRIGDFDSTTIGNAVVENMLSVQGASEFYQDALFKGSVTINGALTVKGIASALDIREGGVLLKDKYSQLTLANTFTENNAFLKAIAANGGVTVDGKTVISADGNTLYEGGTALSAKYLGKTDKATSAINADKLGNVAASSFARRDANNTMTGVNTFNQAVRANGGLTVDGKTVISADGNTLYEGGAALSAKYLGKTAKAASAITADKLGGIAASLYARRDVDNTYSAKSTFNNYLYANSGVIVDGKWAISADGNNLYEGGTALSAKYLGKTAKAASAVNADKLGNVAASSFARRDANNTMTGANTFNQAVRANGGLTVDGKTVISADGNTLYEGGVALKDKYLGKNAKAASAITADKLANVAASNYARTDIAETFNKKISVYGGLHVKSDWVRVDGQTGIYFQSYGGGWSMSDSTWIRAYGGKSVYSSGVVQADGGLKVDGKWIASSDGSTLYENNVALSSKYLGKTAKAASAVTADKLGNVAASLFARKDIGNTFSSKQVFNGGLTAKGSSSLYSVVVESNLYFYDSKGASKNLKSLSGDVDSLKAWKAACIRDISDPLCGLDAGSTAKETRTILMNSSISSGNFTLSQAYTLYDYIEVYGANDDGSQGAVTRWTPGEIDYLQSKSSKSKALTLFHSDNEYWTGRFSSNKRSFTTADENSRIHRIVGVKL